MITATEARGLAGPTVQERVDMLEPIIKKAAENKQRSIKLHDPFWVHDGYSGTKEYKEACKILENLGYKVKFYYMELQFVDMYTIVEW